MRILNLLLIFIGISVLASAQQDYSHKARVSAKQDGWHAISIQEQMLNVLHTNLNGIRLYKLNGTDTSEIPWLMRFENARENQTELQASISNEAYSDTAYECVLSLPKQTLINQLTLTLGNLDYDYQVHVYAANDKTNWVHLGKTFRIIDIPIQANRYTFTTLHFSPVDFLHYKIVIPKGKKIILQKAVSKTVSTYNGLYEYAEMKPTSSFDKNAKTSTHEIIFENPISISACQLFATYPGDYYRHFYIYCLQDSVKTPSGKKPNWKQVYAGIHSSVDSSHINFSPEITKALKMVIHEGDNPPLNVQQIRIHKPALRILAQLQATDSMLLVWGNKKAGMPNYDIGHFQHTIPEELPLAETGPISLIVHTPVNPLLTNNNWLWIVLIVAIALMGLFTLKMLKKT